MVGLVVDAFQKFLTRLERAALIAKGAEDCRKGIPYRVIVIHNRYRWVVLGHVMRHLI